MYPTETFRNLVYPSTANRRFREWTASGAWSRFWQAVLDLRRAAHPELSVQAWEVVRLTGRFPVGDGRDGVDLPAMK